MGQDRCALCAKPYGASQSRRVIAPGSLELYLCQGCYSIATDHARAHDVSRFDAVVALAKRLEQRLLGRKREAKDQEKQNGSEKE